MKVRYIGLETMVLDYDKIYEVIEIEPKFGWYRIMSEAEIDYIFPPIAFEIVEE